MCRCLGLGVGQYTLWSGTVYLQCHRLASSTLGSFVGESFMGAEDTQGHSVRALRVGGDGADLGA